MAEVVVRDATADDVPAIRDIYNQVLATSTAVWRDEPVTLADRQAWFAAHQEAAMPVLVAVRTGTDGETGAGTDGETGAGADEVVGFGSFVQFRAIPGYHPTVEHTIHVGDGHRGAGIGGRLLDALTERARALGKSVMIAGADGANLGSIRFHERAGFREVARLPGVGRKDGRPVDLVLLQLDLDPADPTDPTTAQP